GISGSPYHMFQESLYLNGSAVNGVGAQDRSIKVGVAILPTIVVVNKAATPTAANQNFTFTTGPTNAFFVPGHPANFVNSFTLTGSNQFLVPQGTPSGGTFTLPASGLTNV